MPVTQASPGSRGINSMFRLVAVDGPLQGEAYPIVGTLTVGSAQDDSVQLADTLVRPRHAQFKLESDGGVWVEDFSGTGSTLVNGRPVERGQLVDGAHVQIGGTPFVVQRVPALMFDETLLSPANPAPILLWQTVDLDGRYRITEKLASGGMGDVYKAVHLELDKTVAIKILKRELSDGPDFVERFKREAIACARIGQHNIVDISDFGRTSDGRFYFVMEYLDGKTLTQLLAAEQRLSVKRALGICVQIAKALNAAHSRGIIHRDLKPDNIIILQREDRPDFVKVLDFGVSKVAGESGNPRTTGSGMLLGTPQYMSPEQASGMQVDSRSDIYSLGLILYELVTGHAVFEGATPSLVIAAQISQTPPPMSSRPDAPLQPAALEALAMRMLLKKAWERPQTMADVITELERLQQEPVVLAPPKKAASPAAPAADVNALHSKVPFVVLGVAVFSALIVAAIAIVRADYGGGQVTQMKPPAPISLPVPPMVQAPELEAAAPLTVTLESKPQGAVVFEGEEVLGLTPLTVKWPQGRRGALVFKREGFIAASRTIAPEADLTVSVELETALKSAPPPVPSSQHKPAIGPRDNLKDAPY